MSESNGQQTLTGEGDGSTPAASGLSLLALVLALAAVAALVGAAAQGWSWSEQEFSSYSGEWLKQFLRLVAFIGGSYVPALFLVGAVLAHAVGGRDDRSGAAQAALWICFGAGLVVAGLAVAAVVDALVFTGNSTGSRVTFGYGGEGPVVRFGVVMPTLAVALVSLVVSWCAFKELPISQAPSRPGPPDPSDTVVDAEEA